MPTEAFRKLKADKQAAIVRESMKEFAAKGYAEASTADIAARAGIAKGSLFYYFESKEELYMHLIRQTMELYTEALASHRKEWSADLLERVRMMTASGLDLLYRDPLAYRVLNSFLDGNVAALRDKYIQEMLPKMSVLIGNLFEGVDTGRFSKPPEAVYRLIGWVFSGIKLEIYNAPIENIPREEMEAAFFEKLDVAITCLRDGIYK